MAVTKVTTKVLADDSVTIDKIADAALVLESEGISSNDNDTTIPTSAAVKDYADTQDATKEDSITGAATTITGTNLTASKALISNSSGKVAASTVTDTELGYISGVTSSVQDQFDNLSDNNTTYTVSASDGDNSDEEKIVLTGSDSTTDEIVLEAGSGLSISRAGDKITFTNTITDTDTVLTSEQVEDIVGAMVTGNTQTGITVIYDDSSGKLNFIVDDTQKVKQPHSATATTFAVTVDSKSSDHRHSGSGSSNGFYIDTVEAPYITLTPGNTYKFDQSDSTNTGHPIAFYYESDKTTSYSTGVTTNGTPGNSGAFTSIVATDSTPTVLHYQCTAHALMGNTVNFDTRNFTGFDTDDLTEGTANSFFTNERAQDAAASMITGGSHTNLTATYDDSSNTLDLAVTGGGSVSHAFKTISIAGESDVVADSATDTLTLEAGANITLTTDASTDKVTIASTASGGGGGSVDVVTTQHTGNSSTTAFALDSTVSDSDAVQVYLNGVYQIKDTSNYSISGSTLTFVTPPTNSTAIEFVHFISQAATSLNSKQFTGNNTLTDFDLVDTVSDEKYTFVFIQGVYQEKSTYSISGSTLTFSTAPQNGYTIEVMIFGTSSISAGGGITWDGTPKTADFTAVASNGYFINTASSAITVTLPSSPSAGDEVSLVDYGANAATNNITITSSDKIEGATDDIKISSNKSGVRLVYSDATKGWIISLDVGTAAAAAAAAALTVDYLVVAGGGGGGGVGGAGAGGLLTTYATTPSTSSGGNLQVSLSVSTDYQITVGGGGTGTAGVYNTVGTKGSISVFENITATGGGSGAGSSAVSTDMNGGSGGGGGWSTVVGTATPSGQGFAGGLGYESAPIYLGGGGGGASATPAQGVQGAPGAGGEGVNVSITGSTVGYAGGGGGCGFYSANGSGAAPTVGGGGAGFNWNGSTTSNPTPNPGTNGKGGGGGSGGNGGSGVIILRYPDDYTINETTSSQLTFSTDSTTVANTKITTFTGGDGTIEFTT